MSRDLKNVFIVNNISEEYKIVENINYDCGGIFKVVKQALVEIENKFYDILTCICRNCNKKKEFIFDINCFFGKELMF